MKLIHSSDQHLDSDMNTHLPEAKAIERRAEILKTFTDMIDFAVSNDVKAILLSGDLFDRVTVSRNVQNTVASIIKNNKDIIFYYLRGNHDNKSFLSSLGEKPDNLKVFGDSWVSYELGKRIAVSGVELNSDNADKIYDELKLDEDKINLVMLHGNVSAVQSESDINISRLAGKNIDYLSLGHIHSYKKDKIDARGEWCYSGCLEGRGFDEPGDKGFVLLDINEESGKIDSSFISFAGRHIDYYEINVSEINDETELVKKISDELEAGNSQGKNIVDIRLIGEINENLIIDTDYLIKLFEADYYFIRIKNRTSVRVDISKYASDISLKGEFIRTVMDDDSLTDKEKGEIISLGLKALRREDITGYVCGNEEI